MCEKVLSIKFYVKHFIIFVKKANDFEIPDIDKQQFSDQLTCHDISNYSSLYSFFQTFRQSVLFVSFRNIMFTVKRYGSLRIQMVGGTLP